MTFGYFRKNPSSGKFPEHLLPEVPEEVFAGLPEDTTVTTPFPIFFGVFYPKVPLSYPTTILHNKSNVKLGTPTSKDLRLKKKTSSWAREEEEKTRSREEENKQRESESGSGRGGKLF